VFQSTKHTPKQHGSPISCNSEFKIVGNLAGIPFWYETKYSNKMNTFDSKPKISRPVTRSFGKDITNTTEAATPISPELIYIDDIFAALLESQGRYTPIAGYIECQPDVSERMRAILLDWIVEVHLKFKLVPETLYIAINIIDRYLGKVQVTRTRLQLVGVSALLIACKYEEIYPPEVKDFVYITDSAYSREEVLSMETEMLRVLDYNVTVPSTYKFLELVSESL
jgi:hypothetical protein